MTLNCHSVPGSAAGITYQFERALYWLASSPQGFVIGIETDDDVAVRGKDGSRKLEQDKHSVRDDAKPFGDRSKDLWNTLAIWITALDDKEVFAEETRFFMVTNKRLSHCVARSISNANTDEQVTDCVDQLEKAAQDPPESIKSLIERVLRAESRDNLKKLIQRCELIDASDSSSGKKLREETITHLQLPELYMGMSDSIVDELLGWLHNSVLTAWEQGQTGWIKRDHFVNQLHSILDNKKRQRSRERAVNRIPLSDDRIEKERGSPFVKQIYLVTDDDNFAYKAIGEYIRCNIEKIRLSREGNVTDDDWLDFEETLKERWEKIRARIIRMNKERQEEEVGFLIFIDTTEEHREKLAGCDTEQVYLTAGSYHRLANNIIVGWHPRFKILMQEPEEIS